MSFSGIIPLDHQDLHRYCQCSLHVNTVCNAPKFFLDATLKTLLYVPKLLSFFCFWFNHLFQFVLHFLSALNAHFMMSMFLLLKTLSCVLYEILGKIRV